MVKDVDIFQPHTLQALIQAGQQIFSAAPVAIGALPHIIPCLCGNDKFIPVRCKIFLQDPPEILLSASRLRPVIVRKIKLRDPVVERSPAKPAHIIIVSRITEVMPQSQRDGRKLQAASPAVLILHGFISVFRRKVHNNNSL